MTDEQLLRAYRDTKDADALGQLASRYRNLVFAAARRQIGDPHLADDVAQAVFLVLARKAHSVRPELLAGWLINAARLTAMAAQRGEQRRQQREQKAATMKQQSQSNWGDGPAGSEHLDDALASLRKGDRAAVTLRYLQGLSGAEVAGAMGISEAAAAKRVSRAVARLRTFMARRGAELSAPSLIALMDAQSRISAPAVSSASSAAREIATAALAAMTRRKFLLAIPAAALLVAFVLILAVRPAKSGDPSASATLPAPAAKTSTAAAPTSRPLRPINVGVYLSHYTATGPSWVATTYGYFAQTRTLEDLHAASDLILKPVVEPQTETLGQLPEQLRKHFRTTPVTDVTAVSELRKLDVIVMNHVSNIPPEALDAIEEALKQGTGLYVRQHMATGEPGFTPQVMRLLLLAEGQYGWNPRPVACEVVGDHPLLGNMAGKTGRVVSLYANGPYGILAQGAIPLIRVKEMSEISPVGRDTDRGRTDFVHHPLYVGQYVKGRVVVCSFAAFGATPAVLQNAAKKQFTARCVRWAAGQPVE